jgi:hypothetical protein
MRQARRRVFVYLPLVGENDDDDEKNERARAREPQQRFGRDACERTGRHQALTLTVRAHPSSRVKRTNGLTAARRAFSLDCSMARATSFAKPISIFAFVARFHVS